ncbi:MAG: inositol-3-phosphate synthase [Acidimicrobiia bacterium]|nr:inositol-3-phosphate synthase [Acidimicrobiia bacterium]MYF82990.1 inositol-3-phosphate synthase [Acidimicrobiia bacterium]
MDYRSLVYLTESIHAPDSAEIRVERVRVSRIRVAIVGVGNCASSLVQGVEFYRDAAADETIPGLMHPVLGDYAIDDIQFVAAFDVDATKVGQDLSKAILAGENNTTAFAEVPYLDVTVQRGPTLDGIGAYLNGVVEESAAAEVDVAEELRKTRADVVVSYLPVGSQQATEFYARQALEAGCVFVNCIPVFIARTEEWADRFRRAGLPIVGDDIKSQVGATILHRTLVNLFQDRGVKVDRTYQLNFGGNTDFLNMLERSRLVSKKESKTKAVTSQMETRLPVEDIHVGPSDHVPWLTDRKWAHIRLEGTAFGNTPLNAEVKLEVWDSPNSAGVVIDALRCAKIGLDRGIAGPLYEASAYFMKSPPRQMRDEVAREALEAFIDG